jgi:hypothetical protein
MPANYTVHGEFEHDLALGAASLPSLRPPTTLVAMSDNELWGSSHKLRRALNGVRFHVQQARAELDAVG